MEEKDVLIKVEGLSKKFCKDLKRSLWYGLQELNPFKSQTNTQELRRDEFWAIKDVSFKLKRGECLGLIGHNGAGKSTLLKILNGLINPDEGKVTIKGRVGALIELGAGFNPILTGRENIYNNGAVLGFSRQDIDSKLEAIIAFAELEEFIDMPVQNYSSGMKVRLGFAVAAQMEPDVLIIDEVLAVGDMGFVLKCYKTIDSILPQTAVIFVSHSMPMVSRICTQIILMEQGKVQYQGFDVGKAVDLYYARFAYNESVIVFDDGSLTLEKVKLLNKKENEDFAKINWGTDLMFHFKFRVNKTLESNPIFRIILFDKEQRPVAVLKENTVNQKFVSSNEKNVIEFIVKHKKIELSKGVYSINILVAKGKVKSPLLRMNDILKFQVLHEDEIWQPFLLSSTFESL